VILLNIDLTKLYNNNELYINENVYIENELLKTTKIKALKNTKINAFIRKNFDEYQIEGVLSGIMVLLDDVTLEDVDYEFSIEILKNFNEFDNNLENNLKIVNNSLDLLPFLWQNILLEVPLKVRGSNNNVKLKGDGWQLISEDDFITNNKPLANLEKLLDKRKE